MSAVALFSQDKDGQIVLIPEIKDEMLCLYLSIPACEMIMYSEAY